MSPSAASRRRQRSTRLVVAVLLLAVAAAGVAAGVALAGTLGPVVLLPALAGALAVVLGAAATRMVHTELAQSRRDAARDRAEQAQDYRRLAEQRSAEQARFVEGVEARLAGQRDALARLEDSLAVAELEAVEARRVLAVERRRLEAATGRTTELEALLDRAEERAAEAIVHLAELEQRHDVLLAEREAARLREATIAQQGLHRRHA